VNDKIIIQPAQPEKRSDTIAVAESAREAIPLYYSDTIGQTIACIALIEEI